jgi:hypothetical protein
MSVIQFDHIAIPPFRAPAGPPDPPPSVTLLGVRLRAHSAERAATLRLAVDVDADAHEGPTAVEFASARPLSLPQAPHPLPGTSFRRVTA